MKSEDWQRLKEIFHAVIDLPDSERAAALEKYDETSRHELEKLMLADESAADFIVEPAFLEAGFAEADKTDFYIGKQIDAYRILEEIGHGGMGTVYLAARRDDFEKRVALKLIKRGMDTNSVLKRFVMERQILAQLEHPFIANLLDGGSTDEGLPYLVMEYVEGRPVTTYFEEQNLNIEERLALFQKICSAVSFAHQNLVVHRDIKPSNILITTDGTPKLLDFGIAKLLHPDWSLDTNEVTATMFRVMTPEYASPEQLRGLPVTTASDVYSLGVVLYELLTGARPYKIESRAPEEVAQFVLTEEPVKPSAVVSGQQSAVSGRWSAAGENTTSDEQRTTTDEKKTNPKSQIPKPRSLRGDLDNIILKALRKEPERRYQSVQEFSEDIRRHLTGLPVTAMADTRIYRFGKFVKRHRAGVFAGTLMLFTILLATTITTWQAIVAKREQAKTQQRFNQVRKLANTVLFEYHDGIAKLSGSTPMREKMVKDALEYLDNLSGESVDEAELQRELAAAYQKVGDVQGGGSQSNLGNRDDAIVSYRKSLAILQNVSTFAPNNSLSTEIAAVHGKLYTSLLRMGQKDEAETHFRKALEIREQLASAEPDNLTYRLALARSYRDFGSNLAGRTTNDEGAINYLQKSNELCEQTLKTDPSNLEARAIAGLGYRMLGGVIEAKEPRKALEYYQKALALTQEREKLDAKNAQIQIVLADCYSNIGRALMVDGNEQGALENFDLAMKIFKSRLAEDPNDALVTINLSQTYNNIGNAMAQSNRFAEALENYKQALKLRETYLKEHPTETGYQFRLGETTFDLGDLYAKMANEVGTVSKNKAKFWQEAKSWYQRSLEIWQALNKTGMLAGNQIAKPEETQNAITRCDTALAQLPEK